MNVHKYDSNETTDILIEEYYFREELVKTAGSNNGTENLCAFN
jgi:hypothetical protein